MKILLYGISKTYGGIENIIYNLCKNMDESFVFDVLCNYETCAYCEFYNSRGGRLFTITRRGTNPIRHLMDVKEFFKKNHDYDYVWVNTASASSIYIQRYASKYTQAKIITHSHGTKIEGDGIKFKLNMLLHRLHYKEMMGRSDLKFACSKLAGDNLFGKNSQEVYIVNNGIDTFENRFITDERHNQRKVLGLDNEEFVMGIVGRLSPVKNHKKAFNVLKCIIKTKNCKLFVIGDGELREELAVLAAEEGLLENIVFTGYRNDVNIILNALDVIIMPSFHEGLPVVGVEAQCNGVECFFSDTITKEINLTEHAHFLDINADDEYWANEIMKIKVNDNERELAYKKVKEMGYDITDIASKLGKFLKKQR